MRLIEKSIIGKKSQEECEDGVVVTEDFVAVIDGSTSKTPRRISPGVRNGRFAMTLVSGYIQQVLSAEASVDDFCIGVTDYIRRLVYEPMRLTERLLHHPEERLTASVVVYSKSRNELWMVGDCQAFANGRLYENSKPYEETIAKRRVELIHQGLSPAEARKRIEPMLIEAMLEGQNRSYAVVDGFPIYMDGVKVIALDGLSKVFLSSSAFRNSCDMEIVLASDGYPMLRPTLAESEAALAKLMVEDPQCVRDFLATKGLVDGNKSFDDRAYVRFEV